MAAPGGPPAQVGPVGDRKVVTILFADLSGSTSLQERLDAEATARLMARVQIALAGAIDDHGGRVVKSTGDGLMAVFGVPVLREDDALRAVRAGLAMQESFRALGIADVALRVGINTGEVVVSPDSHDVVGDPVNVAARLEAKAELGAVLVGPETMRLVRDVVELEPVAPLELRGKSEPVPAARAVRAGGRASGAQSPFLGREEDLRLLLTELDRAETDRSARLVTVIGWPGLGKSRLAAELVRVVATRATVVEARFVADGGSSFGPIAVALQRLLESADLDLGADADRVRSTITALVAGGHAGSAEQVSWAIRRAIEAASSTQPVLVVLDDLHWAEPAMLDLVEHLAEWLRGGAVLLLVLARPEVRDRRPSLVEAAGPSAAVLLLDGLDPEACHRLALDVLGADDVPHDVVTRVLEASEGNPLFLRELLRLLVDDGVLQRVEPGSRRWRLTVEIDAIELPATIHAALAARIEQLHPDERSVLQAASVIGRHFERGAVESLLRPAVAARLDAHLESLHNRALVDPDGTWWRDERVFRFHHVLIRDAAYRRVLKEVRADHHVRYADWLIERLGDDTAEHDEVLGYHLEQALGYRQELGHPVDASAVERAVRHLAAAGQRALDRDDVANAASLLGRALAVTPGDPVLLRARCEALVSSGDVHAAAEAVASLAAVTRDERARAIVDVFEAQLSVQRTPDTLRDVAARAAAAAATLAGHGDDVGLAHAEAVHASALAGLGQVAACEAALDRSLAASRRVGDLRRANVVLSLAPAAALWGPSPIARASGRCLDVVRVLRITSWAPHVEAHALRHQAVLEALRDRADAARRMLASARETFTELGHRLGLLETAMYEGLVELLDGRPAAAEPALRRAVEGFGALGARASTARATALLARSLLELGRVAEAETIADPLLAGDDLKASIGLLGVAAEVLARQGAAEEAEALARRAVALAEPTDALVDHADARLSLARVLAAAGRDGDAALELDRARALYEAKGATAGVRRAAAAIDGSLAQRRQPSPAPARHDVRRRIRPHNLAVATVEHWSDAMASQNWDAATALLSPARVQGLHRLDHLVERGGVDPVVVADLRQPGVTVDQEVLAAIGRRHVLVRRTWRHPARDDRGELEMRNAAVVRVDERGVVVSTDTFDGDGDLLPALGCLYERWAEDEMGGGGAAAAIARNPVWQAAALFAARDWDTWPRQFAPDAVLRDHRTGGAAITGRPQLVGWARSLAEAAPDATLGAADVLAATPRGLLVQWAVRGTRAGGAFVHDSLLAARFGGDGHVERLDLFALDDAESAWRCVDAMDDDAASRGRRVRENEATATSGRMAAAIAAGDVDEISRIMSVVGGVANHDLQVLLPADGSAASLRAIARSAGAMVVGGVATLGERHALERISFRLTDLAYGGDTELVRLIVTGVEGGRVATQDVFGSDDLCGSLACLCERWAHAELDGVARDRGARMAEGLRVAEAINQRDWDRYAAMFSEEVVLVDHRTTGIEVRGRQASTSWVRELVASADEMQVELVDVLALTADATLWAWQTSGTVDGGPFTMPTHIALRFGASGAFDRLELFTVEQLEAAWDCFERLDGGASNRELARSRRQVASNQASAARARLVDAMRAGDVGSIIATKAPEYVMVDHRLQLQLDRDAHRERLAGLGPAAVDQELLATLGERHALHRTHMRWSNPDDPGGVIEIQRLAVSSVDEHGLVLREDNFESEELARALGCLYERWATDELEDPVVARRLGAWCDYGERVAERDWDGYGELLARDVVQVDHRPTGAGEIHGRDAAVAWIRELVGVMDHLRADIVDVLAVTPRAALVRNVASGTVGDGPVEIPSYVVGGLGTDGRLRRFELFPLDRLDDAWACFGRVDRARPRRRSSANAATAAIAAAMRAAAEGGIDATAPLYSPHYVAERHDLLVTLDLAAYREEERWLVDETAVDVDVVVTLGDRHCLYRLDWTWDGGGPAGESRMATLVVCRVDEQGRFLREDLFPAARLDLATTCVVARWAEDEATAAERRGLVAAGAFDLARAMSEGDWVRVGQWWAEDAVVVDHRHAAVGVEGASEIVSWSQAFHELAGVVHNEIVDVLALAPDAVLLQWRGRGEREGSPWVIEVLAASLLDDDGRIVRTEHFELDQIDEAWRCFDELAGSIPRVTGHRRVRPNLATAVHDRWAEGVSSGDPAARTVHDSPEYRRIDHELLAELPGRRDDLVEQGYRIAEATFEPIAALGDRHALCRMTVLWRDAGGQEVRFDRLAVTRVDREGRVAQDDLFAADDLGPAVACLLERWAEDEANLSGPPATARLLRARRTGDWSGIRDAVADDVVFTDHAPGGVVTRGVDELLAWQQSLHAMADDAGLQLVDVLALEPDRSLLEIRIRGRRDGGSFEQRRYNVNRAGPDDRVIAADSFLPEQLDDAWACYERRHPASAIAEVQAVVDRLVVAHNERDVERFRAGFTDDAVITNHRPASFGAVDADGFTSLTVSLWDLHDAPVHMVVQRVAGRRTFVHSVTKGPSDGGGTFEIESWVVLELEGERVRRMDTFDVSQRADADAFFERGETERGATALQRRWVEAALRGDLDAATALLADDHELDDRRRLVGGEVQTGPAASRAQLAAILDLGVIEMTIEPIASRGDRVALVSVTFRTVAGDEVVFLNVIEADAALARLARGVVFDAGDIDDALAELDAAAARFLPEPVRLTAEAATEVTAAYNARDLDRLRAAFTEDAVVVDHRPVGWGTLDVGRYVAGVATLQEQSGDARMTTIEWLHLDEHCLVSRLLVSGRSDGAGFESPIVSARWQCSGKVSRIELFAESDVDEALARARGEVRNSL